MEKEFLTAKEAAKILCVHPLTVSRYANRGIIPFYRIGKIKRYERSEILQFMENARHNSQKQKSEQKKTNPFQA